MLIGVPLETAAGETRVAVTPETAKKLKAQGHTVRVQSGAGVKASATDEAYAAALAVFGEKDLVDLTLTIAAMNAINRMGISFRMKPRARARAV